MIVEKERRIPVVGNYDVIVCGGGIAGVAAAIALALYVVSLMCFLNGLDITLTLPGIPATGW